MDNSSNASNNLPSIIETSSTNKGDPFWEYGVKLKGGKGSKCKYCNKELSGGITRLKEHLAGTQGNCGPCQKVHVETRQGATEVINLSKSKKEAKKLERQTVLTNVSIGEGDENDNPTLSRSNIRGPMDKHVYLSPSEARKEMVQAIGVYGPNLKPPSMHEVSENFLPMEKDRMDESLKSFKEACRIQGCSLMTDAWTDRRGRSIMNLVVNCNSKTIFMHSKNASGDVHNARYICDFVIEGIKEL